MKIYHIDDDDDNNCDDDVDESFLSQKGDVNMRLPRDKTLRVWEEMSSCLTKNYVAGF